MKKSSILLVVIFLLAFSNELFGQQKGYDLYQKALIKENAKGDMEGAIQIYRQIVKEFDEDRSLAAKAQLHIGLCYEKLGKNEAVKAYEMVLSRFPKEVEAVSEARGRLAALQVATTAGGGPVARMLLTSSNPTDNQIENPRGIVPSPDGRRVAYLQSKPETKGIYIRDLATGEVRQIVRGQPAVSYKRVVWSADGKRLAFTETNTDTKSGSVRIFDFSSREVQTVPVQNIGELRLLDWTKDGRYLLCNKRDGGTLELLALSDGTITTLSDSVWFWTRASFSPDGRFVAYGAGPHAKETLYVQSIASGLRNRITESGGGVYLHPLWSPDGSAIAIQQSDGIWVVPMDDGLASGPPRLAYRTELPRWAVSWTKAGGLYFTANSQRNIPLQVGINPSTGQDVGSGIQELTEYPKELMSFRWSPDRRQVILNGWENKDLTVYSTETRASTSYDPMEADGWVYGAMWSPDGKELWYQHIPSSRGGTIIKALNLASGQVRELYPLMQNKFRLSLSADGRMMTFVRRGSVSSSREIVIAETGQADGLVVATLPGPDGIPMNPRVLPQLSPMGDQVFYALQQADTDTGKPVTDAGSLWVVGSDGKGARLLTTAPFIHSARWDPSGRFIAYMEMSMEMSNSVLRVVDVVTGAEYNIPLPSTEDFLTINDWSHDGRFIGLTRADTWWEYWAVQGVLEQ